MQHLPFWDFRPYQAIGAPTFRRADFKAVAGRFYEDALWLLGSAGMRAFDEGPSRPPALDAIVLERSGYAVARRDWSAQADYVCFDVGEQAAGMRPDAVPNSMHGHADCLSVVAFLHGKRVLVDSGLYAYNCGGAWEAHFRETAAHNTARIDGRDQAKHIGKMAWSHSYRTAIEARDPDLRWIVGSHDGYSRGPNGVVHRRAVWLRPDSCLVIYDEFVGRGVHTLEVNYQFAPGSLAALSDGGVLFDDTVEMMWAGTTPWTSSIQCGGDTPDAGWICPSLGVREPAPRLTLTSVSPSPRTSLVTVLASRADGRRCVRVTAQPDAVLLAINAERYTDVIAAAGISDGGPVDTDALLAACAVYPDGSIVPQHVNGTYLQVDRAGLTRLAHGVPVPAASR